MINVVEARLGAAKNGVRYRGIQIDSDARRVTVDGEYVAFSRSEYDFLKLLLENKSRVFTRDEVLAAVWPEEDETLSFRSLELTVARVRRKLGSYAGRLKADDETGYCFDAS